MKYDKSKMTFVKKGWGSETWIVNNDKYCGKILTFEKGKKLSVHYHINKDETFYLQKGKVVILWCKLDQYIHEAYPGCMNSELMEPGDALHIPPKTIHQVLAIEDSALLEFSTHHEEEDSMRIVKGD